MVCESEFHTRNDWAPVTYDIQAHTGCLHRVFMLFAQLRQGYFKILTFIPKKITQSYLVFLNRTIVRKGNRCTMTMRWYWGHHRHFEEISRYMHCRYLTFEITHSPLMTLRWHWGYRKHRAATERDLRGNEISCKHRMAIFIFYI